jgi:hypothetical protein
MKANDNTARLARKLGLCSLAFLAACLMATSSAQADYQTSTWDYSGKYLKIVGLTDDGRLVTFRAGSPRRTRDLGYVLGLQSPDSYLVGIDYRVQDGKLYGVGNGGGVYRFDGVDAGNAGAVLVNRLVDAAGTPVALQGQYFGVDFNPAADRLRIVSDTGQNLRHNVNTGGITAVDDPLDYPPGTPLNTAGPAALGVAAAAYTNNDLDAKTGTSLFDIDTTRDQLALQSPPNNGSLAMVGALGLDVSPQAGFDVYSQLRGGVAWANMGFAALNASGYTGLYRVSLTTGATEWLGRFREPVIDIAIPLNQ